MELNSGLCVWDEETLIDLDVLVENEEQRARQKAICASYDEDECMAAESGLKSALCIWRATPRAETMSFENVHRLVVGAMNAQLSALDVVLGVAFLLTAAFGIHQLQQWWKERRQYTKSAFVAKADAHEQRLYTPVF
jgi:hypothetical protein